MLSIDDSEKLTIPLAIYVSKDEPLNEVRWLLSQYCMFALFAYGLDLQYNKILSVLSKKPFSHKNDYKNYSNMLVLLHESPCFDWQYFAVRFHGWAAARADLQNEENRKEYVSVSFGYTSLKYDRFDDVYGRLTEYFKKNLS